MRAIVRPAHLFAIALSAVGCTAILGLRDDYERANGADAGDDGPIAQSDAPGADSPSGDAPNDAPPDVAPPDLCKDGKRNQDETDTDCGGATCNGCANGRMCGVATDCASGACAATCRTWQIPITSNPHVFTQALVVDASNNTYVGGSHFGPKPFSDAGASQGFDAFVIKISPSGAVLWTKYFGGSGSDEVESLAIDGAGNVIVAGRFASSFNLDGTLLSSAGGNDVFVAKLSASDGQAAWAKGFGGAGDDQAHGVTADASGDVLVTGEIGGSVTFGAGPAVGGNGDADVFVAKLAAASGTPTWSRGYGGTLRDSGSAIRTNAQGDVFVTGGFHGSVNFGGGALSPNATHDLFVLKLTSAGAHGWSERWGGSNAAEGAGSDSGRALAVDASGDVFIGGQYVGASDLGGTSLGEQGSLDGFVAKYSGANGAHVWSHPFGGSGLDTVASIALDASGNVYAFGTTASTSIDFGGGARTQSTAVASFFLVSYASAGAHRDSRIFPSPGAIINPSLALRKKGDGVLIAGSFATMLNVGGGTLAASGAGFDGFVTSLGPVP